MANFVTRKAFLSLMVLGIACVLMLSIFAAGCRKRAAEVQVTRRDITAYAVLEGEVAAPPAAQANILPPYEAPVDKILVTVGQEVREGDVLMELSAPNATAYYERARARVQQARQQLSQAQTQYGAEVRRARTELQAAQSAERAARSSGGVRAETDDGEAIVIEGGNPGLDAAVERRLQAELALADAQARMDAAIAPYQQQVALAQRDLQEAQSGKKAASVRTPIRGTVLKINVQTGEAAEADKPVVQVVDLEALKVYGKAEKDQVAMIELKDPAVISLKDLPNTQFEGSVLQIFSQKAGLLQGVEYVVVSDFRNEQGQAKPGMAASSSIEVGRVEDVLAVPAKAVSEAEGNKIVKVKGTDGQWADRVVETGISDGEYTEIKSGLQEGDMVQVPAGYEIGT